MKKILILLSLLLCSCSTTNKNDNKYQRELSTHEYLEVKSQYFTGHFEAVNKSVCGALENETRYTSIIVRYGGFKSSDGGFTLIFTNCRGQQQIVYITNGMYEIGDKNE